jgi:hypothetical protein
MVTIAHFTDVLLAHVAASKLRSEGLLCFVADEYLVGIQWQYSLAIGGVRVMVREADSEEAIRCLGQDESHLLCEIEVEAKASGGMEQCEECGSPELRLTFPARKAAAMCLLLSIPALPFFCLSRVFKRRFIVTCSNCGHQEIPAFSLMHRRRK